jgi:hypothetical protein
VPIGHQPSHSTAGRKPSLTTQKTKSNRHGQTRPCSCHSILHQIRAQQPDWHHRVQCRPRRRDIQDYPEKILFNGQQSQSSQLFFTALLKSPVIVRALGWIFWIRFGSHETSFSMDHLSITRPRAISIKMMSSKWWLGVSAISTSLQWTSASQCRPKDSTGKTFPRRLLQSNMEWCSITAACTK